MIQQINSPGWPGANTVCLELDGLGGDMPWIKTRAKLRTVGDRRIHRNAQRNRPMMQATALT